MKPYRPIKPSGRSVNDPPWWHALVSILLVVVACLFMAVMLIEWAVGCGESYTDANGVRHQHECVFIPQPTQTKE